MSFAGTSTGAPVSAENKWQTIEYTYKCFADDNDAFVQINVGRTTGTIKLKNFGFYKNGKKVINEDFKNGKWRNNLKLIDSRKTGVKATATDGVLTIVVPKRVEFPWDIQLCTNKIKLTKSDEYKVAFEVKADHTWKISSYLMRMNPLRFYARAGKDMFWETLPEAINNGVKCISPVLIFPWPENQQKYPDELAFTKAYLNRLKEKYPEQKWILRIGLEPPNWWRKKHPSEMTQWEDGTIGNYVCIASEKWLDAARKHIHEVIGFCESNWGDMIYAYVPVAQSTGEWYYPIWINRNHGSMNHSPAFLRGYHKFLKARYNNEIRNLNRAWNCNIKSFSDIKSPTMAERKKGSLGVFRDPVKDAALFDFSEYQQYAMRNALEQVTKAIKQSCITTKKVVAFYGYLLELPGLRNGITETGHLQLGKLLENGILDGVVDIVSYYDRGAAGSACLMTPVESIYNHGRILFTEDDSRTHLSSKDAGYDRTANQKQTIWAQSRNLARSLVHNANTWKFDLYGEGWFADNELWKNLNDVVKTYLKSPPTPYKNDIAVFIHEKSFMALPAGTSISKPLIYNLRSKLARNGFGDPSIWLLNDLIEGRIKDQFKLLIFPNAFMLTSDEKNSILKYCKKNRCTALWLYAPGYLSDKGEDFSGMKKITGFDFKKIKVKPGSNMIIKSGIQGDNDKAARKVSLPQNISDYFILQKRPYVTEKGTLESTGDTLFGVTENAGYKSIYCANPAIDAKLLANVCTEAGAWRYSETGNVVICSDSFMCVNSMGGGNTKISLPFNADILDITSNKKSTGKYFTTIMKPGETKIFLINKQ